MVDKMKEEDIKINLNELKSDKEKNFRERLWFVKYWANYIRTHSDMEWSKQQNVLIDSQIQHARKLVKNKRPDSN